MSSLAGGGGGGGGAYTKGTPVDVGLDDGESITVPSGVYWIVTLTATSKAGSDYNGGDGHIFIDGNMAVSTRYPEQATDSIETVVTEGSTIKYEGSRAGHIGGVALPL